MRTSVQRPETSMNNLPRLVSELKGVEVGESVSEADHLLFRQMTYL